MTTYSSLENFKIGISDQPLCGGVPSAVYIGSTSDKLMLEYMKENYERVFPIIMYNLEIPLYFLPESLKKGHARDCILYNSPYLNINDGDVLNVVDKFNSIILDKNNIDISNNGGIAIMDYDDPTTIIDFYPIYSDKDVSNQLNEWMLYVKNIILLSIQGTPDLTKYLSGKVTKSFNNLLVDRYVYTPIHFSKDFTPRSSDEQFDEYGYDVAKEIRDRINILKERGFMHLLVDIIKETQQEALTTSRLKITKDYKIFLPDWNNNEVIMRPLPKAIYILFLNHPEGILFKELIDYKGEIRDIYKKITSRDNIEDIEDSINALVDPMNNSINEKCSRIRAAFLEAVSPEFINPYIITGKRGEPKRITLDRKLIELCY